MKNTSSIAAAVAAFACLLGSASAQVSATVGADLILGFRADGVTGASPGSTGNALNLEINLGPIANYVNGSAAGTISALVAANLTSVYGATWNTRTDLFWGIAGSSSNSNKTLYTGLIESTPGVQTTFDYDTQNQAARNSAGSAINSAVTGFSSLTSLNSTSGTASASDNTSWTTFADPGSGVAFGFFNTSEFENTTAIAGGSYAVTDLWRISTASGAATPTTTYLGSFGLNSSGVLTFSTSASAFSAVPEPSTYAAIAGACALALAAVRRRRAAKALAA